MYAFGACNVHGIILFVLLVSVLDAFVLEFCGANSVTTLLCCVCARFLRFGWPGVDIEAVCLLGTGWQEGISVDGLLGIKGEKDELLYTPTSFLVSLDEQDEAYLEHRHIFCSSRFYS
ncbi:hypothetical protein BDC45DRAFT_529577 [Circinella umbellata]|nr:hypothetical protein BDC45DRAFT_577636 [Circinella umbellata]KAI7860966.1 hypothetical protein BDC45DRAFT_529577 [Circinella umbellata]